MNRAYDIDQLLLTAGWAVAATVLPIWHPAFQYDCGLKLLESTLKLDG